MRKIILISILFLGALGHSEYFRNPATCICYSEKNASDSLRIRFRNGVVEAVAFDQLDVKKFGKDILAKKIFSSDASSEIYEVGSYFLQIPQDAQSLTKYPIPLWSATIKDLNNQNSLIYSCSF